LLKVNIKQGENMILRENFIAETVQEYAAWLGAWDHASGRYNEGVFSINSEVALECRLIYELAWELECVSSVVYTTATHEVIAFVHEWNDLKGYGTAEYVNNGQVVRLWFNYNNMPVDLTEKELELGSLVKIQFKHDHKVESGINVLTVSPIETVRHVVWKTQSPGA
jgi:hypothetical protein